MNAPDSNRSGRNGRHRIPWQSTRTHAWVTLASAALAAVISVGAGATPLRRNAANRSDLVAFRAVVDGVRSGEPYYGAMAAELRTRGYPMRSVFNWRTPLALTLVAATTDHMARVALIALAVGAAAVLWLAAPGPGPARALSAAMLTGTVLVAAAPDLVFLPETWTGVLLACSVGAFARHRVRWGVATALTALFLRELAAPYCVACTLMALGERDWKQVRAWILGAVCYGLYFAWHVTQVTASTRADDLQQTASWLQLGGVPAVLASMHWAGWWFLAPATAAPVLFTLLVAGLLAPGTPRHARSAAAVYLAFLLVAGQSFNHYWGLVAAPVWTLVAACGAPGLVAALTEVRTGSTASSPTDV